MSWESEINELREREAFADKLGGEDKIERQHHFGKLTIRERIAAIADSESFHEIGKTAGVATYLDWRASMSGLFCSPEMISL